MMPDLEDDDPTLVPPTLRREPRVELHAVEPGAYALALWGRLAPGWCGNLSHGLAQASVDILWGTARKRDGGWEAEFRLKPGPRDVELTAGECARLLRTRPSSETEAPIRLVEHQIHNLPGAVAVKVRGTDCLGFLSGLLRRLAFLSLFPEEMRIETVDGEAVDRFRLKSMAGRAPSEESLRALAQMLDDLTPRTALRGAR